MTRPIVTAADRTAVPDLKLVIRLALAVAVAGLGLWLWSRICRFPTVAWNDMRLAPTIALFQGLPVYPTADSGTINTWMYGPLPLLSMWPASWASTAANAVMIAAALTVLLTLVPLALVCFAWPVTVPHSDSTNGRLAAFVLCLAVWPELHYSVIFSDNLAVACGLIGNLILVRARSPGALWLAAVTATAALACKQITVGIPLAQILWLGLTSGRKAAFVHAMRCGVAGAFIGGAAIATFGWNGLWYTLIEVPGKLGWAPFPVLRLKQVAPELTVYIAVPIFAMIVWRRAFARPALLLPALAWMCTLPLGIAGMMKVGGWTNSIHSFVLWLPAVLTTVLTTRAPGRRIQLACLGAAGAAAAMACIRIVEEKDFPLRPQLAAYHDAERLTKRFPGALWFPMHPLVTLFSDHHYYHDEDGMYARIKAHLPVSAEHLAQQMPAAMQMMVFPNFWNDWGIARKMLPPNARSLDLGNWTLRGGVPERVQP